MRKLFLEGCVVFILCLLASTTSYAVETVILHSADISEDGQLTVVYSKNFAGCAHLLQSNNRLTHQQNFFCTAGDYIHETQPMTNFSFTQSDVKLCPPNNYDNCSSLMTLNAPVHPLKYILQCDLVAPLAAEIGESFDCVNPSPALMDELYRRLSLYTADLNYIFAKQTIHRFAFTGTGDIILEEVLRSANACCTPGVVPKNYGEEMWVMAQLTDNPLYGTYNGTIGSGMEGELAARGMFWDKIHDPSQLSDGSAELQQYWRQIDTTTHEFEHTYYAGIGEYYRIAIVDDTTNRDPIANVSTISQNGVYWDSHTDFYTDPLLINAWNHFLVGSPTSYQDLLNTVRFAEVTAAVLNHPSRLAGQGLGDTILSVPDFTNSFVNVYDSVSGQIVEGALVNVWDVLVVPPYTANPLLIDQPTGPNGDVDFSWNCTITFPQGCLGDMILVKVYADGYEPGVVWFSSFDGQALKVLEFNNAVPINVELTPLPDTAPVVTITSPGDGSTVSAGSAVNFVGTATDSEDGDLSASIIWSSNIDGQLGIGSNVSEALSAGVHTITASVTDSGGNASSTQLILYVVAAYCSSGGSSARYEWIDAVQIGAAIYQTGSNNGYLNNTNSAINLSRGMLTDIHLTPGFAFSAYNEYWKIWIDLNQNGVFEASEQVFSGNSKGSIDSTITLPDTAITGNTRMRVSLRWAVTPSPCGNYTWGEVEDYTVDIY